MEIKFTAADMIELGKYLAQAGVASNHNPGMGVAIAWDCRLKNISPIDYDKMYNTIAGKVCPTPDYMLSLLQGAGGKYKINEESENRCEIELWYKEQYYKSEMTLEFCKKSGWAMNKGQLKHNYKTMPRNMLYSRAVGHGCRRVCPELLFGMYTKEEISDTLKEEEQTNFLTENNQHTIENTMNEKYFTCPIGPRKGRKWEEFSVNDLKNALSLSPIQQLGKYYIEAIKQTIKEKEGIDDKSTN